uniref:phosphopyruvate hydratase n=1 Tax=Amorphochlora amoebiformis TaxID=1561963 RepID=A0A7S0DK17_9EUKA
MTPEAREIMAYLQKYNLADQLNVVVNKLCKKRSDDPFGFLASRLHNLAAPPVISKIEGREVLGTCATPTIEVDVHCKVDDNIKFIARGTTSLPPDGKVVSSPDAKRYRGLGVDGLVNGVSEVLQPQLGGIEPKSQAECDAALSKVAGAQSLGNRTINAASIAICKSAARLGEVECFTHVRSLMEDVKDPSFAIPRPMMQLIDCRGPGCNLFFRELLVFPLKSKSFKKQLEWCCTLHHQLGNVVSQRYGGTFKIPTKSGGYAPPVSDLSQVLKLIGEAADAGGLSLGEQIGLAISGEGGCWSAGYLVKQKEGLKSTEDMVKMYISTLKGSSAVHALIDPLAPTDLDGWAKLKIALMNDKGLSNIITITSDIPKSDLKKVEKAAGGASLDFAEFVTVSGAIKIAKAAKETKLVTLVSSSAEESHETFIADFAVGVGATFVKFGGAHGMQNIAKYNRLLQIESILD